MKSFLLGFTGLATICATVAAAQPASNTNTLETVVVTGYLEEDLPQQLAKYGTRVTTIDSATIRNAGYVDIAESLQKLAPGLYIAPKNGPFDYVDISFQGSRTADVLWLVDGIRVNNRLYAGTTPLDTLPSSMIERVEVLEGGQALFYGTQATAGAINVVTKAFSDKRDGAFTVGADSNGGRHFDGYFRDAIGRNQFVVYGSSDKSKGYQPFRDQDYQPSSTDHNRSYDVLTLGGKYAFTVDSDLRLSASYQHTDAKLDYAYPFGANTAFNERAEDLATGKVDYRISDALKLFAKGYYHRWNSHFTEFDNTIPPGGPLVVADDHDGWGYIDYGANLLAQIDVHKGFQYLVGYDYQTYGGDDAVLVITQHKETTHAIFGQVRTTEDLIPDLHLSAGFRHNMPSVGQTATVWNLGGQYDVNSNFFVRASLGTAFRLPTAEELFADDPNDERGNPNLKPERSTYFNASVGGNVDLWSQPLHWEIVGFARDIKDRIDLDTYDSLTNQDVFGNIAGTVKVRGVEFVLDAPFSDDLSANFNFTYDQSRQSGSNDQIAAVPETQMKFGIDYHPVNEPFGANLSVNQVGNTYTSSSFWAGRTKYGDYTTVDISGRYFLDEDRHHKLNLSLVNAFDTEYATKLGRGTYDVGGNYTYWNLGLPRTIRASYTYAF